MGVFDQTARMAARLKTPEFFDWAIPVFRRDFAFVRWADTRTVPFPGDPDRTLDTVAEFVSKADPADRRLLNAEFQSEPDPDILERLGEYAIRLRMDLRHGTGQAGKFVVHSLLLNLTGPVQENILDMRDVRLAGGHVLGATPMTLREEDGPATLARIAAGELGFSILPWVPLLRGADEAGIIQEWRRIAEQETDPRLRATYGALALIFSELSQRAALWHKEMEGWNVQQSQTVLKWQREAQVELLRGKLRRVLEVRTAAPLPEDLGGTIAEMTDLGELDRWFEAALHADSYDAFRVAVQPKP